MKVINVDFPKDQYFPEETKKKQIALHHTVSDPNKPYGSISWWKQTVARVGTPGCISGDGTYYRLFSSRYWIHHLGVRNKFLRENMNTKTNSQLNRGAIGLELCSGGGLVEKNGNWITDFGMVVPEDQIEFYSNGFRGYEAFQKYTDAQIQTTKELIEYWAEYYDLDACYEPDIWDVTDRALNGESGIFTHVSYRPDKSDCHPQPELVKMLESFT